MIAAIVPALVALASSAMAPPPVATEAPSVSGTIGIPLAPPLDRTLLIELDDVRQTADGSRVRFVLRQRLLFRRGEGGLIASITRVAVECDGAARYCDAFRNLLTPGIGSTRRFAVEVGAEPTLLAGGPAIAPLRDGAPGAASAERASTLEAELPGQVSAAELREALRFSDRLLPASAAASDDAAFTVTAIDDASATIVETETIEAGGTTLIRRSESRVDRVTGLITAALTRSFDARNPALTISERRWTLHPE